MTMHQTEWERLSVEEKLDHLRTHQVAQDAILPTVMQALEGLGVVFDDPENGRAWLATISAVLAMFLLFVQLLALYRVYAPDPAGGYGCSGFSATSPRSPPWMT